MVVKTVAFHSMCGNLEKASTKLAYVVRHYNQMRKNAKVQL